MKQGGFWLAVNVSIVHQLDIPCSPFGRPHPYALIPSRVYPPEWELRRVEGCRGPNNSFLCPSASSFHPHMETPSSWKESAQRIMGAQSVHQLYPSKSFIPKGPLKWPVLSTLVWNDPSIWRQWLYSQWIVPLWGYRFIFIAAVLTLLFFEINLKKNKTTTRIPEMLGHFLNLNKMKTKRLSNHMSQYFIHNRNNINV